ncbi:hypothetical protein SHO565_43190 [Streptomyces sp. HO565]
MAQVVAAQVFVAELGDDVVPVGGVAQDCGGDASAARAGEQAGVGIGADGQDALGDEGADLLDDGNLAGSFALGALVDQSAGGGGGLPPDGPDPLVGVEVPDPASGDLADACRGTGGEENDVAQPGSVKRAV